MISFSLLEFFEAALPTKSWFSWIPQSILNSLPTDVRMAIAKIDNAWVAIDTSCNIIYGPPAVEIIPSEETYQPKYNIFATLVSDNPATPSVA